MKKIVFYLALFFPVTGALLAQGKMAEKPQDAITYFFDALAELDARKMNAFLTADFLLLENGEVWNADSLSKNMARMKGQNFIRKNSFRYVRHEEKDGEAIVAYFNRADITLNGKPIVVEWLESAQLIRDGGNGWKIKLLHSTRLKPSVHQKQ